MFLVIDLLHLVYQFVILRFLAWFICEYIILSMDFEIKIYSIFWEIIQVLQRGVITFDIEMVLKSFVFAHSHFLFCAPPGFR